jgi:carboxyl-terminal processing protease
VTRAALLFFVCVIMPNAAWGQSATAAASFSTVTAAAVWGAALTYIAPRSLQALSIPQMTIWGLNGLAALDPDLNTTLQDGQIRLYGPDQLLIAVPAPAPDDANGWGKAAAAIAAAAFASSPALQQAGTQGLISSFFDELFNHFDPYSRYEPPLQAAQDQLMVTGLAGTGLSFALDGRDVVVSAVAADSPAENAGITPGTILLRVNGSAVYTGQLERLNETMSGIYGSTITLTLVDPSDPSSAQDTMLTRAFIPPQTVFPEDAPVPGAMALRITGFNKGTSEQFSTALATAMAAGPPPLGLVIDLRGNRGGVLRQAVLVADTLLPAGEIAAAAGRDPDANQRFTAEGSDISGGAKIILLVDGQTASAAEILSAALSDNRRAVVVGSETLGKGLVQTVTSLPDGGELFVTWSQVLAPRGWPLQTLGVMPQLCTSLGEQALHAQFAALAKGEDLMSPAIMQARQMHASANVDYILSVRDTCPAAIGGAADWEAAAFLLQNPAAYQAALLH